MKLNTPTAWGRRVFRINDGDHFRPIGRYRKGQG
jgi:hypothetical protein